MVSILNEQIAYHMLYREVNDGMKKLQSLELPLRLSKDMVAVIIRSHNLALGDKKRFKFTCNERK